MFGVRLFRSATAGFTPVGLRPPALPRHSLRTKVLKETNLLRKPA